MRLRGGKGNRPWRPYLPINSIAGAGAIDPKGGAIPSKIPEKRPIGRSTTSVEAF
jgi:hypothetical protein